MRLGTTRAVTDSICDHHGHVRRTTRGATRLPPLRQHRVLPFKWVGKYGYYSDQSTGLVYVRARMYAPATGAWCSHDPKLFIDGTNLYRPVFNSPALHVDPSGHLVWTTAAIDELPTALGSKSGFVIPEDGLFALKGNCGAFAWKIDWDPWELFDEIMDPPRRGYIVQKVCVNESWENCPGSNPTLNTFPPIPGGNQKAIEQCPGNCYFELWRVHDGKIYANPLEGRIGSRATEEPSDLFAWLGHSGGCTKGEYEQTGYSFFVWEKAMWEKLLGRFHRGLRGIRNAGILYSACADPDLEADLLRAYEWTPPGGQLGDPQIALGTKRRVKSVWDCCGNCAGEICNDVDPLNQITFEPFPHSRYST
jgi:RHS repeat-associated protein